MSDEKIIMPKYLTAENGAKAQLIGEFFIEREIVNDPIDECYKECDDCNKCSPLPQIEKISIPWDTIKDIYNKAVEILSEPLTELEIDKK